MRTSVYRGFRAPTLNELYRPFRVGNVITAANSELSSESLWGVEGGADFHPVGDVLLRVNGFWNRLSDAVGNVTVGNNGNQILRQRQNLDGARIAGLELEGQWRLAGRWFLQGAYLLSDSEVTETGRRLPQVPRHQGSAGVSYRGRWGVTLQGRWSTEQFEDDLNALPLGGFAVFDLFVRRPLAEKLEVFVALENIFDHRFAVGRNPVEVLGEPRLIHGGVRLRFH